jgi:hypothetical protein
MLLGMPHPVKVFRISQQMNVSHAACLLWLHCLTEVSWLVRGLLLLLLLLLVSNQGCAAL